MKICTYYEDIGFKKQQELIRLWYFSWASAGFEPVLLSLDDAKTHPLFDEFNKAMSELCENIQSKNKKHKTNDQYVLSCHRRWLAYAAQEKENFLVSDYDVISPVSYTHLRAHET